MTAYPSVSALGPQERIRVVRGIFSSVQRSYDLLNGLLSLRRDAGWRAAAAERMRFTGPGKLLDVACGTADLCISAALRHPGLSVTGIDFSAPMLRIGRSKVAARGLQDRISLTEGDALALPFPDAAFDMSAIAFGLRNIPDRLQALREMRRVTAPGGRIMVLEMTFAPAPALSGLYDAYLTHVLPWIAALISPNPAAYAYLSDSIRHFPRPEELKTEMEGAGISRVAYHGLSFGITYLHVGRRPKEDQ